MFRSMRRFGQQIGDSECIDVLVKGKRGVLAVLGDDDYPYAVPMNYVYEDGHVYFHGAREGHKIDSVRRHDKASFCVVSDGVREKNDWWFHFVSVIVFGRIREVSDEENRNRLLRLLGGKYLPTKEMLEDEMRQAAARAAVLDLEIEHMTGKRIREK